MALVLLQADGSPLQHVHDGGLRRQARAAAAVGHGFGSKMHSRITAATDFQVLASLKNKQQYRIQVRKQTLHDRELSLSLGLKLCELSRVR